jgi:DoxX-like family
MSETPRPNPYTASQETSSESSPAGNYPANPAWMVWTGRVISALPVLMLLMSAVMKFLMPPGMAEGLAKIGWREEQMLTLGILELACTIFYVIPQTSVLGAILLTGYLGGATATHVRVGESWIGPVMFGVLVWLGLFLRDARLRRLLPLRNLEG